MLIEQCAYGNHWRSVSPTAKGLFALAGFIAAFVAAGPATNVAITLLIVAALLIGARIRLGQFLRVAFPPLGFLGIGCLSLAYSVDYVDGHLVTQWLPLGWLPVETLAGRSCAALAALLFLALTTPMTDLIGLLRRLKCPEMLLEIMVLCYRMLFVFSEAMHDTHTAQASRLGYSSFRLTLRSLGSLTANLTIQIWQRARALHIAAQSRNNDGPLRFLEPVYPHAERDLAVAAFASLLLIIVARVTL